MIVATKRLDTPHPWFTCKLCKGKRGFAGNSLVESALQDTIRGIGHQMKALEATLRDKAGASVDLASALAKLKTGGMKKETVERVKTMYEAQLPVEALPEQPGLWRLANVVSMIANQATGDAHLDLQDVALNLLFPTSGRRAA